MDRIIDEALFPSWNEWTCLVLAFLCVSHVRNIRVRRGAVMLEMEGSAR